MAVWFEMFGFVHGLLETLPVLFPEGGRSEVEKLCYHLSKMNLWGISSDSICYSK